MAAWNPGMQRRAGDAPSPQERERAHAHYASQVAADPENAEAWLRLSYTETDLRRALDDIQRAVDLRPNDPAVQAGLRHILSSQLQKDAFVEFLAETDGNYVVTLRHSRPVVVPKARNKTPLYPPSRLSEGDRVARLVAWMALGLVPAGLGAFVLAPFVIQRAIRVLRLRGMPPREQRVALVALVLACGIGLLGEILFGLFLLHWLG